MDRRETLKSLMLGTLAAPAIIQGCAPPPESEVIEEELQSDKKQYGRTQKEKERDEKLASEQFFTTHEIETIAILCDLILPPDDQFGGAVDAGVPEFIEFISKDLPSHQLPIRGGLMWLDNTSNKQFQKEFKSASTEQQKLLLDTIAFPNPDVSIEEQGAGIRFFDRMRDLTLTGYYTSKIGIEQLGYKGNRPNVWDGVPEEVLKKHGLSYEEEWLAKCIDQDTRADIAKWDDDGNLLT